MKKKLQLLSLIVCNGIFVQAQQINTQVVNYETGWEGNLNHTTCNIFNISPFFAGRMIYLQDFNIKKASLKRLAK